MNISHIILVNLGQIFFAGKELILDDNAVFLRLFLYFLLCSLLHSAKLQNLLLFFNKTIVEQSFIVKIPSGNHVTFEVAKSDAP